MWSASILPARAAIVSLSSRPADMTVAMDKLALKLTTGPAASVRLMWPVGAVRLGIAVDAGAVLVPTRALFDQVPVASQGQVWFSAGGGAGVAF